MTWPFENDTHKVEKKLATQSLSANKQRNFLAGIIMFIASLLLAFSTILLCNATIDTQIISRVDNTQEILSVILGIAIVLLLTAGIAIKNIMYISILQRTREFAQLRTVGATYRQIKAVIHNERKQLSWKYILGGLLLGFLFNCVLPLKLYLDQKTGESMEKPGKKLKKFFIITGITGMVYAGLKYLLPLVVPLLLGYTLALLLRPSARFLQHRITVRIFGKKWKPSLGLIGSVQLLILAVLGSFLLTLGIRRLWEETSTLMNQLPVWLDGLYFWIEEKCSGLEKRFGLDPGWGIHVAGSMIEAGTKYVKEKSVPSLMAGSYYTAGVIGRIGFISLFSFCSAILSLQEMEELKERRDRSVFSREFRLIGDRLVSTGKVWFKSQGIIFLLTSFLCTIGMFLVGNPCPVLVGMGIGIMDAFPVLGTGTVLVPWAVIEIAMGSWKTALILTGLYLICTFMRQFLEVHLMSGQMGLSPFETLGAVYVGLKLFGIAGLFLGPLGLLLIEDMTELLITQPMNDEQRHNETNKSAMIDGGNRFMSH